jgi:hypothetical protein
MEGNYLLMNHYLEMGVSWGGGGCQAVRSAFLLPNSDEADLCDRARLAAGLTATRHHQALPG